MPCEIMFIPEKINFAWDQFALSVLYVINYAVSTVKNLKLAALNKLLDAQFVVVSVTMWDCFVTCDWSSEGKGPEH